MLKAIGLLLGFKSFDNIFKGKIMQQNFEWFKSANTSWLESKASVTVDSQCRSQFVSPNESPEGSYG